MKQLTFTTLAAVMAPSHAADGFAPAGAKATLSVEYRLVSEGSLPRSSDLVYLVRQWRVTRSADMGLPKW